MLVECPRCHFRQPQDQYCASCGVDMIAFKPKEEPILTQIAKSGLFQFMMVIALGVGVTWFVIRTDRPQQWIQKINRFASVAPNPSSTTTAQNTEAGIAEDSADLEAPPAAASAWAARSMVASAPEATTGAAPAESLSARTVNPASATQTVTAVLAMTETENESINASMQKAFAANSIIQDGDIKIFVEPAATNPTSSEKVVLELNQPKLKNYGSANRGLNISMTLVSVNENAYSVRVVVNKVHPNDTFQIPVEVTLRKRDRLYISGHPLLSYFELETDLINTAPFRILRSADFRNQKTTFAIEFELQ